MLLDEQLARLAVTGRRAVAALGTIARVPVLGAGVANTGAVYVTEIPGLAGEDRQMAPGALGEAGFDHGGHGLPLGTASAGMAFRGHEHTFSQMGGRDPPPEG